MADPISAPPKILLKKCRSCRQQLPIEHFGLCRTNPDGYSYDCKACRSQRTRLTRIKRNGKALPTDDIIRSIYTQNRFVITYGFNQPKYEASGFCTIKPIDYKVYFGPADRNGMKSICLFNMDGSVYREFIFSGGDQREVVESVLAFLRIHSIRLELTQLHAMNSKALLYFTLYK